MNATNAPVTKLHVSFECQVYRLCSFICRAIRRVCQMFLFSRILAVQRPVNNNMKIHANPSFLL